MRWLTGLAVLLLAAAATLSTGSARAAGGISVAMHTEIHDGDHTPFPCFDVGCLGQVAPGGSVVHDFAIMKTSDSGATPTGTVMFAWFASSLHCMGNPTTKKIVAALGSGGVTTAESSNVGPLAPGDYSYRAIYIPDKLAQEQNIIRGGQGPCEQLLVEKYTPRP